MIHETLSLLELTAMIRTYKPDIARQQVQALAAYIEDLIHYNKTHNLTGLKNPREIIYTLIIDSLVGFSEASPTEKPLILDIGSGAGIPAIPISIVFPHKKISLIESTKKKCIFIESIIDKLDLRTTEVICERAETMAHDPHFRGVYDIVTSRAVAPLNVILELALPFLKIHGLCMTYKGTGVPKEIKAASAALTILGGTYIETRWYTIKEINKTHAMALFQKCRSTPETYPRRPGMPAKRPLS